MTIELRCRKLKWATVPVQSWQMVITPLPTLSSTAQCPFSRGSYILTTMVSIYTLAAMVIQRQWSEWQWLEKLTTLDLWRLKWFFGWSEWIWMLTKASSETDEGDVEDHEGHQALVPHQPHGPPDARHWHQGPHLHPLSQLALLLHQLLLHQSFHTIPKQCSFSR